MLSMLRYKKIGFNFGDDVLISTLITTVESRVRRDNIIKLKPYMWYWLSIKPSNVKPRSLPYHAYPK